VLTPDFAKGLVERNLKAILGVMIVPLDFHPRTKPGCRNQPRLFLFLCVFLLRVYLSRIPSADSDSAGILSTILALFMISISSFIFSGKAGKNVPARAINSSRSSLLLDLTDTYPPVLLTNIQKS
jgi:hypothetical protein